ncbi:gliding motility-associated C-terminal domain-containing protein [Pontimicrobium sp. IMCC45349]|uniref:DUF7933 domain-containing protein n=1 Tax=Pontimicrobium sp. IMCC45349 TaxID=3391574 RepID=UPI0039A152AC
MNKLRYLAFIFSLIINYGVAQTTDLSVVVEAQDLSGNEISQAHIYEEFQYIVTIINTGDSVTNASFTQVIDENITVLSYQSQNQQGGASEVGSLTLTPENMLLGTIADLPNNSSVQVKVIVKAPLEIGGVATNVNVFSPSDVQDTDLTNNQSIISIDITDVDIDFTVTYSQVTPPEGTGISAWGDTVTYQFTITNNSIIDYPLDGFRGKMSLSSPLANGQAVVQQINANCISGTNGTDCPATPIGQGAVEVISSSVNLFEFLTPHVFTSGGSLTFDVTYQFLEPACGFEDDSIEVQSNIELVLNHTNESSNLSNSITTELLPANPCEVTDPCIETVQINPDPSLMVDWGEEVTFETTVCNNGPLEAPMRFFLQNLSPNIAWNIISVDCIDTTNGITCNDFTLSIDNSGIFWTSNNFIMPVGATITVVTVVEFIEPECVANANINNAHIRTGTNLLSNTIFDSDILNSVDSDYVILPDSELCPNIDLTITKTQISPILPEGESESNTTSWGEIVYEITATNLDLNEDALILIDDFFTSGTNPVIGTLTAIDCVSTTGTAECFSIPNNALNIPLDGIPQDGENDMFWQITVEDNWVLPANSSVTFTATVLWEPECDTEPIRVTNNVEIDHADANTDNIANNDASVSTFLAPCIDLVVQTFPESTSVLTDEPFNWIVDISNSVTSSSAVDVLFENILSDVFTVNGTPTCEVTSGNATCVSSFNIDNNLVSGTIPSMEAGSTVRIYIPVIAPQFGGAFPNQAEATPSPINNEEITPETNISISNVQVLAPELTKQFNPETIVQGFESTLTFTVHNIDTNAIQNGIGFIDNLPAGITLSGEPFWVNANGCTAQFTGTIGDDFVGISNLTFPEGVASCSFAVNVTSNTIGTYINEDANFSEQVNIDTSQTYATLNVIEDTSNVDIEVLKSVTPEEVALGGEVTFTISITNLGTTTATAINILEQLPNGYSYVSSQTSNGIYDELSGIWSIDTLLPSESESLTIVATVSASTELENIALLNSVNEIDRDDTNNEDTASVTVNNCLNVPEGISPNNDTYNDTLVIPCIEDYENNILKIYNRYGALIYETTNYDNSWNGIANIGLLKTNEILPVGTYFYVLEIKELNEPLVGWVYLNY